MSVEGLAATRTKVLEVGGRLLGKYLETNTFFDSEDRSLLAADKGLRLRHKRNIDTGEEHYIITYKGPRQPGALKFLFELIAADTVLITVTEQSSDQIMVYKCA